MRTNTREHPKRETAAQKIVHVLVAECYMYIYVHICYMLQVT